MCLLFETVKIFNGKPENLDWHDRRLNLSRQRLYGPGEALHLSDIIKIPDECKSGIFRCRIIYGSSVITTEFTPYIPSAVRTLKLVHADDLEYDLKYLDRSALNNLINRTLADDILIVKKGCITDTSFSNIAFSDGRHWVTPDTPLLCGTMREKLLSEGIILTERITLNILNRFTHFKLINAMLGFGSPELPTSNIL
jgi:4-amino-4-deoxychorismate lyase